MTRNAFSFLRDFAEPEQPEPPAGVEEDDRLAPEDVERMIESARAEAFERGHAQGLEAGRDAERATISARLEEKVTELHGHLAAITAREDELFSQLETRTARLMLALVHQLAKRLSEVEAKQLAENVATRAVEAVRGKHRVTIRATAEFIEPLRQVLRLPTDDAAAAHRVVFEESAAGGEAPLEVAWLTGKVTFDPYAFTAAIDEVFTETLKSLMSGEGEPFTQGESQ